MVSKSLKAYPIQVLWDYYATVILDHSQIYNSMFEMFIPHNDTLTRSKAEL